MKKTKEIFNSKKILAILTAAALMVQAFSPVMAEDFDTPAEESIFEDSVSSLGGFEEEWIESAGDIPDSGQAFDVSEENAMSADSYEEIEGASEELPPESLFEDDFTSYDDSLDGQEELSAGELSGTSRAGSVVTAPIDKSKAANVATNCTVYSGSNVERQNYEAWSDTIKSYLCAAPDGQIMRVQGDAVDGKFVVEYFDKEYNYKKTLTLDRELPIFGGFYEGADAYYVLTGRNNLQESDSAAVFCVTKYSKAWDRLGSANLYGANTVRPFDFASARFDMYGKYLLIRTGHAMYTSDDGANHQANVVIQVDTSNMTITDSHYKVLNPVVDYVSHSLNQFVRIDGNEMIGVDQGDAYPRGLTMAKIHSDLGTGSFDGDLWSQSIDRINLYAPGEDTSGNYIGATAGGFEISDTHYLVAGTQDAVYGDSSCRNIFIASVPKNSNDVTIHTYTKYDGTGENAMTPQFVKLDNNRFVLFWSSNGKVYYTEVNGSGSAVGNVYTFPGNLSDCVPALIDGKLIWYTWDHEILVFYEIPVNDLSQADTTIIVNGHKYVKGAAKNGEVSGTCSVCGYKHVWAVPTGYSGWWKKTADDGLYWSYISPDLKVGEGVSYWIQWQYTSDKDELPDIAVASSDSSVLRVVDPESASNIFWADSKGKATVAIHPVYNPDVVINTEFYVNTLHESNVVLEDYYITYTGSEIKPKAEIIYAGETLREGIDYTISYKDNLNAGTGYAVVKGTGDYIGEARQEFTIAPKGFYGLSVKEIPEQTYTGSKLTPVPVIMDGSYQLQKDKDFRLSYENNVDEGYGAIIVEGIGNYDFEVWLDFYINPRSVKSVSISAIPDQVYTGKAITPLPVIKYNGKTLKRDTDYFLDYEKNLAAGTATINVTGMYNFTGSRKVTFKIKKPVPSVSLNKKSATIYTAGVRTVTLKGTLKNAAGTVRYKSGNTKVATVNSKGVVTAKKAGKATITAYVTISKKTYSAACTVTVKKPVLTVSKTSLTVKKGKTVKITAKATPKGTIKYTTGNKKIATVTSSGLVKGIKKGTTTIKVTCNGVTKKVKVTVK